MLAIVCPGQGAQTPGFLRPWLELPGAADHLDKLSAACGVDLRLHGTESDADTIRDTAVAQPLIVASGLVALRALFADGETPAGAPLDPARVAVTAGHSVGEITATAAAGVIGQEEALALVGERGRAMAEASAVTPTGMSAVLGGSADEVAAVLARHGLTAANANGAGQVVAAGTLDELAALAADPPRAARVIPLQVAGAFHTRHMAPAVDRLAAHVAALAPDDPRVALLSNADGAAVAGGAEAVRRLVLQVSNPVRWDLCMATMTRLGVTAVLELPPAGTLANLAKRAMKGVSVLALKTPDDLDAARVLLSEHGGPVTDLDLSGSERLSPTGGTA